ncbi:MAG: threonine/serine exporter family protein [Candidatus Azobacteroides sp.]|nr:threonine/serine exporter family protein [Candidatus Azobacteroides sp.]
MMWVDILTDGAFAAVAGIGFGAISLPPKRAFKYIALLAAIGHAFRFTLINYMGVDIASASFCAAVTIGLGSLWLGAKIYTPMTVLYIPSLLPMIPGMYAYRSVFAMVMFLQHLSEPEMVEKYMREIFVNGTVTISVIFTLAVGATIPIFIFQKKAYSLTRRK